MCSETVDREVEKSTYSIPPLDILRAGILEMLESPEVKLLNPLAFPTPA